MRINDHMLGLLGSVVLNLSCILELLGDLRFHPRYSDLIGLGIGIFNLFSTLFRAHSSTLFSLNEISASKIWNYFQWDPRRQIIYDLSNHQILLRISSYFNASFYPERLIYYFLIISSKYYNEHNQYWIGRSGKTNSLRSKLSQILFWWNIVKFLWYLDLKFSFPSLEIIFWESFVWTYMESFKFY